MHKSQAWLGQYYRFDAVLHLWHREEAPASSIALAGEIDEHLTKIIHATFDRSSLSPELQAAAGDRRLDEHFSPLRANLLRPLAPLLRGTILQIGADSGALTRFLGETAAEVVAVEANGTRAAVAAARCADLANVSIVADAPADLPPWPAFDAVILVEPAHPAEASDGLGDSFAASIGRARGFLRPGGLLVVAASNRQGLDVAASAGGVPSRAALAGALAEAGLSQQQWWFPLPDRQLPTSLLSDKAIGREADLLVDGAAALPVDRWKKGRLHALQLSLGSIFRNPDWPDQAGAFLVAGSEAPLPDHDVLAVHYGSATDSATLAGGRRITRPGPGMVLVQRRRAAALPALPAPAAGAPGEPGSAISLPRSFQDELAAIVGTPGWTLRDWTAWARRWLDAVLAAAGLPTEPLPSPATSLAGQLVDAMPERLIVGEHGVASFEPPAWQIDRRFELGFLVYRGLFDSLDRLAGCAEPQAGVPLGKMALFRHFLRSIGWQMSADDIRRHVALEGRIEAEISGAGERPLWTLHDPIPVSVSPSDLRRRADLTLAKQLAAAEARAEGLETLLKTLQGQRTAEQIRAAAIERDLLLEREAAREAQRELGAVAIAGERMVGQLRRAYSKPWVPVRLGLQRIGLRLLLLLEPLLPKRTSRRLRSSLQRRRPLRFQMDWELARALPQGLPSAAAGQAEEDHDIALIEASGLFDAAFYAGTTEAHAMGISPIAHYVRFGEESGLAPSAAFDPDFYGRLYPDVVGRRLRHYLTFGRGEGRSALPAVQRMEFPRGRIDPARRTVLLMVHEASRTGAPILAWNIVRSIRDRYNVVAVLQRGGGLLSAFEQAADTTIQLPAGFQPYEAEYEALAKALIAQYQPDYVIANSVETRGIVPSFERNDVPVVALVHEFSSYYRPVGHLYGLLQYASQIVFPAQVVADAALNDHRHILPRRYVILPQGRSELPVEAPSAATAPPAPDPRILRRPGLPEHGDAASLPDRDGTLLVVGMGTITMRKGVDAFISVAADVARRRPDLRIAFAWAGEAFNFDQSYVDFIEAQVERSGLGGRFSFLGAFTDLDPLYDRTDILILSSRLDPLPNVSIDCAVRGIPVLCFENASGMAEILLKRDDTRELVVPYLDAASMAERVIDLATDEERRARLGRAMRNIADTTFDMKGYVGAIDALAQTSLLAHRQGRADYETIKAAAVFNATLYQPGDAVQLGEDEALRHYLQASRSAVPRGAPNAGRFVRRPVEGFHPLVYAGENPAYDEASGEDPLAHYLRSGSPNGPWRHAVIIPDEEPPQLRQELKVAIQAHFHYPELLGEFIGRMAQSRLDYDLLITTTSDERKAEIERSLTALGVAGSVSVVPNRGRDIGPLFSAYPREQIFSYDLIGHFHGKRSPHAGTSLGETWRTFLWEHLVGGEFPMLDTIASAFQADPRLGLVFAEDPFLWDWSENREIADEIAARMGVTISNHFDFPIGTMFWARPAALAPIFDLDLSWDDYPPEPLPIDGTLLHVMERMLPFAAKKAGYDYATTYVSKHRR